MKDVIRRGLAVEPASYWSDHVPGALIALRLSAARSHGYPPFTVVTGLIPVLPSDATTVPAPALLPDDVTPVQEKAYAEAVARTASFLHQIIKARLMKMELTLM